MKTTNNKTTNAAQTQNKLNGLVSTLLLGCLICTSTVSVGAPKKSVKAEAPKPVTKTFDEASCIGNTGAPGKLVLPVGKSTLLQLPNAVASRTVGNPGVLQAKLIAPQTLYLLGVNIGTTNMIVQGANGTCTVVDVIVNIDPEGLQQTLSQLLPDEKNIKVTSAADSVILTGTVEDAVAADNVVQIANAFVRRQAAQSAQTFEKDSVSGGEAGATVVSFQQGQGGQGGQMAGNLAGQSPRVINLLSVSAQQQVMLEVKVAEVSKTLLDKLGIDLAAAKINGNSSFFYNILPSLLSPLTPITRGTLIPRFAGNPNLSATTGSNDSFRALLIDAEKRDGLIKILAEPSIMAISGQEGSFLAGGTIFIPVAQNNNNGAATITLEEKEFGVGVKFTPTVLAGGRINLKVAPEVSELNRDGVGITASGISGTAIFPSFTTRRASTTVQLMDGQSFAIGGLIKNNTTANIRAFPILGELPIIGALFRSTDFQKDKTELIFVVTPHLVKPLTAGYKLPTDNHIDPSRTDIFLKGQLEGTKPVPPPISPATATNQNMPAKNNDNGFELK